MRRHPLLIVFLLALVRTAHADPFDLKHAYTGNVEYVFVGAALTDNTGLNNGVNCLLPSATTVVNPNMLSANPKLVSATLYLSGSLIDDGVDYAANNLSVFNPGSNPSATALQTAARAAAAVQVNFKPPGTDVATLVTGNASDAYVTTYSVPVSSGTQNIAFFTTPIDVTSVINGTGKGVLHGTFEVDSTASASNPSVGQILGDVCNGLEAVCSADPNNICSKVSAVHNNGTASFGLLLVYEDLALPLYSVNVFEGLYDLNNSAQTIALTGLSPISDPAAGALSYYVIEGDITLGSANASKTCGADEYVQVSIPAAGSRPVCFNDADNPVGNIFNGTINTQAAKNAPAAQCPNTQACCGPSLCGLAGVDIDRFDISAALAPGATEIDVTLGTYTDRVAVASVVLGAQVFQALLSQDTQVRTFGTVGDAAQVGNTVTYALAISNTGNIDANQVVASIDAPAGVGGFQVLGAPPGANCTSSATGGVNATGTVACSGFNVEAGKVQEIRFVVTTQCAQLGSTLDVAASVAGQNVSPFAVPASTLTIGGPGAGLCVGLDPRGPFSDVDPVALLRGGGCTQINTDGIATWLSLAVAAFLAWRGKRRAATIAVILSACSSQHIGPTAKEPQNITSAANLPGQACSGDAMMLQISPADGNAFCIDRFEATTDGGALGNAQQASDGTSAATDGSTHAQAQVGLAKAPAAGVSWYQAKSACVNAGKRLCTQAEWEYACRGAAGLDYPYGPVVDETKCNGFFQYNGDNPAVTGSFKDCVSGSGVYDMSGNVEEWLDTAVPREPDTTTLNDRMTHGGSYNSNDPGLACVGVQFHAPPGDVSADRGFRCCK